MNWKVRSFAEEETSIAQLVILFLSHLDDGEHMLIYEAFKIEYIFLLFNQLKTIITYMTIFEHTS